MQDQSVLIVGGGIGGLTAAIALLEKGHRVEVVERDAEWTTYGVGIIQQFNVIRAMGSIGMLDAYLAKAFGFDRTTIFVGPGGEQAADFETPRLAGEAYPSNAGIRRRDLQDVLVKGAQDRGARMRLGTTVEAFDDDGAGVDVTFSDGSTARYDMVVGADGVFSKTRGMILPEAPQPRYTGQWVWRYNLPKPDDLTGIQVFVGPCNAGLVPLGQGLMYMFDRGLPRGDHRRCRRCGPPARGRLCRRRLAQGPGGVAWRRRSRVHAALGAGRRHGDRGRAGACRRVD